MNRMKRLIGKAWRGFGAAPLLGCGPTLSFDDECVLHFAARYALGRKTAAVGIVCKVLKREWQRLRPGTGEQIKREVRDAINDGRAGDMCDVEEWSEILMQPNAPAHRPAREQE